MVITELNLKELVEQYNIVPSTSIDKFSITLHLNSIIKRYNYKSGHAVTYGEKIDVENIETIEIRNEYILESGQSILACSNENVNIPQG